MCARARVRVCSGSGSRMGSACVDCGADPTARRALCTCASVCVFVCLGCVCVAYAVICRDLRCPARPGKRARAYVGIGAVSA